MCCVVRPKLERARTDARAFYLRGSTTAETTRRNLGKLWDTNWRVVGRRPGEEALVLPYFPPSACIMSIPGILVGGILGICWLLCVPRGLPIREDVVQDQHVPQEGGQKREAERVRLDLRPRF